MQTKQVIVERFGGPDVLRVVDMGIAEPGATQLLVRVEAAGVLYGDVMRRTNRYLLPTPLPYLPGTEVAGIVIGLGHAVSGVSVGDRIVSFVPSSGYAQYALIEAANVVTLPAAIGFAEATALLAQGVTAYLLTHDVAQLKGRAVFVESAAGGVGMQMIQLARACGARFIAGSASTPQKRAFGLANGADFMVDSQAGGWSADLVAAAGGDGIDVGYESSGASFAELLKSLSPFGTLVKFGRGVDEKQSFDPTQVVETNQSLRGFYLPGYRDAAHVPLLRKAIMALIDLRLAGKLTVHIDRRFALTEAGDAHREIEGRRTMGKIVIEPWKGTHV